VDSEAYAPLEARLGHSFAQPARLRNALTHKSFLNENPAPDRFDNERLEFLGDAVLDLAISHLLMEEFPQRSEGELSKTRAQIVSEAGLSEVAEAVSLGEWLFLGRGEEQTGGRHKPSLLADACEAVIAAVYLDGGFDAALAVARRLFGERVRTAFDPGGTDFKTRLQERAQSAHRLQPRYVVVGSQGPDHDKTFEVALSIGEREIARASGKSKKEAEQRAAERGLAVLESEAHPAPR
jgi:ribonuclease-3